VIQTDERCYDTTYDGISVEACTCNSDYCNTAIDVGRKTSVLSITMITTLCIYNMFWFYKMVQCINFLNCTQIMDIIDEKWMVVTKYIYQVVQSY
jgi:hypothetical protein